MGVEDMDVASPTASDVQDDTSHIAEAPAAEVDLGTDSSDSSSEKTGEKFDLLSVVREVGRKKEDAAASPATTEETGAAPTGDTTASTPTTPEPDNENYSDVPFNKHPRFQQLVAERRQFKVGHDEYQKLTTFLDETGVSPQEAAEALELRALMKANPAEAWKAMKPMVQQLLADAGELLPADLQERVKKGEMTRDAAMELSRLRAAQHIGQRSAEANAEMAERRQQQEAVQARVNTAAVWERETKAKDPDFEQKREALMKEILWLQKRDGHPKDAEGVRKQLLTAYETVNKQVKAMTAAKRSSTPVTGGRGAGGNTAPTPKNVLDIVRARGATG
jgi:hypothetical protein